MLGFATELQTFGAGISAFLPQFGGSPKTSSKCDFEGGWVSLSVDDGQGSGGC